MEPEPCPNTTESETPHVCPIACPTRHELEAQLGAASERNLELLRQLKMAHDALAMGEGSEEAL